MTSGRAQPLDLPQLGADLERVEVALRAAVRSDDPFLSDVAGHLISAGGKRLRPVLALAAAYAGVGSASEDVVQGAVAVELVHLGSLYHDDVMDEASTRRGVESANARWGNLVAILAGDYLLAKASEIAASLGTEVSALLAATIGQLCEGQVRELQSAFDPSRTEAAYLKSITGKTASLMSTSCRVGALAAGLSRPQVDALTRFGDRLGMVFQIADDILDIVATDEQLGKPAGNDVVEGVYTLPVLRALAEPGNGDELRSLLGGPVDAAVVERVRKLVKASGAVDSAIATGRTFADEAAAALAVLPSSTVTTQLGALGHVLLDQLPPLA